MLRRPNEAALARGDAVIRANVSAEDRWHAKTSLSTSPRLCVLTEERGKAERVRGEKDGKRVRGGQAGGVKVEVLQQLNHLNKKLLVYTIITNKT